MGKRSWKTSIMGLVSIILGVTNSLSGLESGISPECIGSVIAGVGLIFARDGKAISTEK